MTPKSLPVPLVNLIRQNQTPKMALSPFRSAFPFFFFLETRGQQPWGPNYHQWSYDVGVGAWGGGEEKVNGVRENKHEWYH